MLNKSLFAAIFCALVVLLSVFFWPQQQIERHNNNTVILFSLDGFRFDYLDKYSAPNLNKLAASGVRAEKMRPGYPSVTFPNHISLVTGKYPAHHGLVHNTFYDQPLDDIYKMGKAAQNPDWLQATPLWVLAEQQDVRSATFFWPESDAKIQGTLPSYYFHYDKATPYQQRIDQIIDWLKLPDDKRPAFIASYFSAVDTAGHKYGPDSPEVAEAVAMVDSYIGQLKQRIDQETGLPVDLIVVSDHGMRQIEAQHQLKWQNWPGLEHFKVVDSGTQLMLYAKPDTTISDINITEQRLIKTANERYTTYRKGQFPAELHYNDNDRIADIVLEAIPPAFFPHTGKEYLAIGGAHGFNPYQVPEMGALFIANGPHFKSGLVIDEFDNVNVFPAIMDILNLTSPDDIDGKLNVLKPAMR
ncbi:ectonucleotide pyrophosphatase/phosphodiesterase [Neptunicella sp. SCSIO 80796]|uniref:alkaline phosphatase family protein n=1 Tax=Neptunicella plasticusilytica TaxID=3117012 RepID=UPI003A4DF448